MRHTWARYAPHGELEVVATVDDEHAGREVPLASRLSSSAFHPPTNLSTVGLRRFDHTATVTGGFATRQLKTAGTPRERSCGMRPALMSVGSLHPGCRVPPVVKEPRTALDWRHAMTADELKALVDRLANILQATLLLADRLETDLRQSARDASDLLTSASRAAEVIGQFRRPPGSDG